MSKQKINGNATKPSTSDDYDQLGRALKDAYAMILTATKVLDTDVEDTQDAEDHILATNALRIGVEALDRVIDQHELLETRLFHEGCAPVNVKKLEREARPRVRREARA